MTGLAVRRWGRGPAALLWLHGFTGDGGALGHLEPALGARLSVVCPDLPGHGASPAPARGRPGAASTLRELGALLRSLPRPRILGGYSQGARLALQLAARAPSALDGLLCESGTAGLPESQRAARARDDERLARTLESDGLESFLARWDANPVLAGLRTISRPLRRALQERRRAQDPRGLAWALRAFGQGSLQACWSGLSQVRAPALVLAGEADPGYAALARRLARTLPAARLELLACGHAPHLEAPREFARRVLELAARVEAGPPAPARRRRLPRRSRPGAGTPAAPADMVAPQPPGEPR